MALRPDSGSWSPLTGLRDHTLDTIGRTPQDECSARRRNLYLTTHNTQKTQTSKRPYARWNSISQSLQASGFRPTP